MNKAQKVVMALGSGRSNVAYYCKLYIEDGRAHNILLLAEHDGIFVGLQVDNKDYKRAAPKVKTASGRNFFKKMESFTKQFLGK